MPEPVNRPRTTEFPALRGWRMPLMTKTGASEPKVLLLVVAEKRNAAPSAMLMFAVKPSNWVELTPLKLILPLTSRALKLLPEERLPENPLESRPEVMVAVWFDWT